MRPLLRLRQFIRPRIWNLLIAYVALLAGLFFQLLVPRILQVAIDDGLTAGDNSVLTRAAIYLVLASIGLAICSHFRIQNSWPKRTGINVRVGSMLFPDQRKLLPGH